MKILKYLLLALLPLCTMVSCKEEDDTSNEYENWEARNVEYFEKLYDQAKGQSDWKIIRTWSKIDTAAVSKGDYIVVHVISEGNSGSDAMPLYTDSVRAHYQGKLMPTTEHPQGYVFDSSWTGNYNISTMRPSSFAVSGLVDGFATALMNMHVGDRWEVYIPYQLAYGTSSTTSIPAYSTLKFDITLDAFARKGNSLPKYK